MFLFLHFYFSFQFFLVDFFIYFLLSYFSFVFSFCWCFSSSNFVAPCASSLSFTFPFFSFFFSLVIFFPRSGVLLHFVSLAMSLVSYRFDLFWCFHFTDRVSHSLCFWIWDFHFYFPLYLRPFFSFCFLRLPLSFPLSPPNKRRPVSHFHLSWPFSIQKNIKSTKLENHAM